MRRLYAMGCRPAAALLLQLLLAATFHISDARAEPEPGVLTLDAAQALAASRSFAISAARREVDASEGALLQAGARRNPELNTSVEDTQRATRTTTATIGFPIELGGKRVARQAAASRARETAVADLADAAAQLRADVVRAFFSVAVAQERVALTSDSLQLASRAANAIAQRVAAGKVSPVDETRARVDEANAGLEADEARGQLQGERQTLASLWGEPDLRYDRVRADIDMVPSRDPVAVLGRSLEASPLLVSGRSEADRRRALIEVERSRATPDVVLSVGARRDNELGRTQAVIGVSVPLPFFDRNEGAIREAARRADKASDDYEATRIRLFNDLQLASNRLSMAGASARTLKTIVLPAAEQAYAAATRGFEAGKFGVLDVIDAQRTLLQARARYLGALAGANEAATAIDRITGR